MDNWKRDITRLMRANKQLLGELTQINKLGKRWLNTVNEKFPIDGVSNKSCQDKSGDAFFDRVDEERHFKERMNKLIEISKRLKQINYL